MAPQNSTLIHNDSTGSAAVPSSAEELSSFSPILPPRSHHHHRHHHHHHHHHNHRTHQQRQSQPPPTNDGAPYATGTLDATRPSDETQALNTKTTTNSSSSSSSTDMDKVAVAKSATTSAATTSTSSGNVASTSRGGSFRAGGGATSDRELQSLPAGRSSVGGATVPEPAPRMGGTGRGTVKRELLKSIPYHSHAHETTQYAASVDTDDSNGTDDTDDAYDGTPEPPPKAETPTAPTEPDDPTATDIEIPIWIRGEARFVSGINGTTTCSNIIRALIDDEIQNGNYGPDDVAVSRDVSDYVIIERWREVEQVLTGDTRILSIWNAWGDAKNEVQFRLKINKTNLEKGAAGKETKSKKQKEKIGLINRMMRKVLKQGEAIQNHLSQISQKSTEKRQQEKFRKYVRKNCGKHLIMENFLHDAATTNLSDGSVDGEPLVAVSANDAKDAKVRRSTFPGKLLFTARKTASAATKRPDEKVGRVVRNVLFESSDQLADGAKANEDELLLVIDHTSDSDSGIFTNNHAHSRRDRTAVAKRPNFGSMVEIDRYAKDGDELEHIAATEEPDAAKRQQKYHRSKRRYDSLRCHHQSRRREPLEYALSEDDGVASTSGGRRSADRDQELVELVHDSDDEDDQEAAAQAEHDGEDFTPPVDDFESDLEQCDLRKGTFNRTSFRFDLIRQEIATKMAEMQQLLEQEEALLRRLKLKSAKFHAENQIYRSHIGLDFHVERLQQSIDRCAKEIIEIEQQLLETKMEIEEKSPLIDNLRSLLEAQEEAGRGRCYRRSAKHPPTDRYGLTTHIRTAGSVNEAEALSADTSFTHAPAGSRNSLQAPPAGRQRKSSNPAANESVEFVDNIYEFCDNNQSFVV